ncbi:hypothetical protein ACFLXI_03550 [Chloroflexota bacterium]
MSTKNWLYGLVLILTVAACSPGNTSEVESSAAQTQLSELEVQVPTASRTERTEPAVEVPTATRTKPPEVEDAEPSMTVQPTITDVPEAVSHLCDDPFSGENVQFPTQYWNTNFCLHSVPFGEIFSGGPPPDGIPPHRQSKI